MARFKRNASPKASSDVAEFFNEQMEIAMAFEDFEHVITLYRIYRQYELFEEVRKNT